MWKGKGGLYPRDPISYPDWRGGFGWEMHLWTGRWMRGPESSLRWCNLPLVGNKNHPTSQGVREEAGLESHGAGQWPPLTPRGTEPGSQDLSLTELA